MKSPAPFALLCLSMFLFQACTVYQKDYEDQADKLAHDLIIVDGHVGLPHQLMMQNEDEAENGKNADFDYDKANSGGLNAPFMAIDVSAREASRENAMQRTDSLISKVRQLATDQPNRYAIATSPQEIQKQFKNDLISLPLGLTNSAAIGHDVSRVQTLYDEGVRYINLSPAGDDQMHGGEALKDSSSTGGRLSNFNKSLVKQMNRVGMMVDVSQLSDSTFSEVIDISKAPVIASHSSARYYTPQFKGNLSDKMITKLAKNKGVMLINFGSNFISDSSRTTADSLDAHLKRWLKKNNKEKSDPETQEYIEDYRSQNYYYATVSDVADHIDHVANLVGIDYVGLGSDFNGAGDTMAEGLKNVSDYPNLIQELLKRGYSEDDIHKICYENVFRVWNEVAATAQRLSTGKSMPDSLSQ